MHSRNNREIRWSVVVIATLLTVICMAFAIHRVRVDSDLTATIPPGDPVLSSGRHLLAKHPLIDWVAIDLSLANGASEPAKLVTAAEIVQRALADSQQFSSVGSADWLAGISALRASLVERLPSLFSKGDLEQLVLPRLTEAAIRTRLAENFAKLGELEGVGQAHEMAGDPLGLRELIYARLAALFPKTDARIEQNQLLSTDGKHLLITAFPRHALGDPESAQRIAAALASAQARLDQAVSEPHEAAVVLATAGAYRAAIDNEAVVKHDTVRAVWLVTIAVSVLLLTCFSRPLFGVLTLLPATAGVAVALLLYSFISRSMSALSLGFGAALISITVDQGIVYIAYLDRVKDATGKKAAQQTFSAVSLATLTTVGAFFSLTFSGYQLLEQLGIFAALGSAFSFVFVHTVFPLVFRAVPASNRRPLLPVDAWLRRLAHGRVWTRVATAAVLAVGLGFFARPTFSVDLNRLNTISAETRTDEDTIRTHWGDLMSYAYVLVEGKDPAELQERSDSFDALLSRERSRNATSSSFSPSRLWPGKRLAEVQFADWRRFWDGSRRADVERNIVAAATLLGFTADAFDDFFRSLEYPELLVQPIPTDAYSLLGLSRARDGNGWVWLSTVERGPNYDAAHFAEQAARCGFFAFDGNHFGHHLNIFLETAFKRMLLIVLPFVLVAVALSFQNLRLVLLVLFPVALAFVATLGTFGLLGRPIDIPGLLIAVVVLGMGTNFSVYLVSAHQRYPDPSHPVHDSVRIAALLDGGATVLGMAILAGSTHLAIQSVGLAGFFGIGFSLFGALFLLPPILRAVAPIGGAWGALQSEAPRHRFLSRFTYLEPRLRRAARRALRKDPRLESLVRATKEKQHILLAGGGQGVEAAWLLANNPQAFVTAIDCGEDQSHITRSVLGDRGQVIGRDWPTRAELETKADAVVLLDLGSIDSADNLAEWLDQLCTKMTTDSRLVIPAPHARQGDLEAALEAKGFRKREDLCSSALVVYDWDSSCVH